jgi:hypothetical protein
MSNNSLRAFVNVKKQERPLALLMFLDFFWVIATFRVLKPITKSLFLGCDSEGGGHGALDSFGATMSGRA